MEFEKLLNMGLSARAVRVLSSMKIKTLEDCTNISERELQEKRGVGKKTIDEIISFRDRIADGQIDDFSVGQSLSMLDMSNSLGFLISDNELEAMSQHSIDELMLTSKMRSWLKKAHVYNMDQVLTTNGLNSVFLKGMGKKAKEELKREVIRWLTDNQMVDAVTIPKYDIPVEKESCYETLCNNIQDLIKIRAAILYNACIECGVCESIEKMDMQNMKENEYLFLINAIEVIQREITILLKSIIDDEKGYIEEESFEKILENKISDEQLRMAVFSFLRNNKIIIRSDNMIVLGRKSLREYVGLLDDEVKRNIFVDRLNGLSLQEIGDRNGITRERARQIIVKCTDRIPLVMEDYYSGPFKYFKISRDIFYGMFPEADAWTYEFLSARYKKGDEDLTTESLSGYKGLYVPAIKEYARKKETEKWKNGLSRTKIASFVLIMHVGGKYFNKDSFREAYCNYLVENELPEERYSYNQYTLTNWLRTSCHVVFNRDGEFRYYENNDSCFLKLIDFNRYKDSVISAELIFRDYHELMDECDIHDGYELFCILKNSPEMNKNHPEILFRRIPSMIFGDGDEKKQVLRLVREIAPIDHWSFFEAYEERYGVRKESACANLGVYIEQFLHEGQYVVDLPSLSPDDEKRIREVISQKPFWTISELERLFSQHCTSSALDALNVTTLHALGFSLNTGYAYDRRYGNVVECLDEYIFSKDIVDLNQLDCDITRISMFQSYISRVRDSLNYIEISPKIFASQAYLEREYGITREVISNIQKKASQYYDSHKYFNGNSIWDLIKDDLDVQHLYENRWLCTSILRQQAGVYVLSVTNAVILSRNKDDLSLAKVCKWITEQEGKMSLEHLTDRFNMLFGSKIEKHKIAFKIKEQGDEQSMLTDGIDEYLEKIIASACDSDDDLLKEEFF